MDLAAFYGAYRADGHGRAAYEPSMMVTLVLYAYATKQRSSRAIESHCRQDVAYRVITGNVVPDHATIARFVVRHEPALAGLFGEVLRLCDQAGLVAPGLVAIDGTRLAGNASRGANREFEQIAREILAEHKATDEAEDERIGEARGDELPEQLRTPEGRREFFRQAKQQAPSDEETDSRESRSARRRARAVSSSSMRSGSSRASQGREGWLRDAKRQLEQHRWQDPDAISRSRSERLVLAAERLEADLDAERAGTRRMSISGARADEGRAAVRRAAEALQPPEVPGREGERDRSRQQAHQGQRHLRAGLQRPGGRRRGADRARGRDHQQHRRLVTARSDDHRHDRPSSNGRA